MIHIMGHRKKLVVYAISIFIPNIVEKELELICLNILNNMPNSIFVSCVCLAIHAMLLVFLKAMIVTP